MHREPVPQDPDPVPGLGARVWIGWGRMAWRGLRTFFPEMMTGLVAAAERDAAQSP